MSGLKDKLKNNAEQGLQKAESPKKAIKDLLEKFKDEIGMAIPKHLTVDRLLKISTSVINQNPTLLQCDQMSLLAAVMQTGQLGLEPNLLGQAYFVPFFNSQKRRHEVQYIIGYRGLIKLARNSGEISQVYAHEVKENDHFEFEYGTNKYINHKPDMLKDRGETVGYYGVIKYKDGSVDCLVMSKADIEEAKKHSKSAGNASSPWVKHYDEMAKKTVLRKLLKTAPLSAEVIQSIEAMDETIKTRIAEDMSDIPEDAIDVFGSVVEDQDPPIVYEAEIMGNPDPTFDPAEVEDLFKNEEGNN